MKSVNAITWFGVALFVLSVVTGFVALLIASVVLVGTVAIVEYAQAEG
jgi:hypothetical protein